MFLVFIQILLISLNAIIFYRHGFHTIAYKSNKLDVEYSKYTY